MRYEHKTISELRTHREALARDGVRCIYDFDEALDVLTTQGWEIVQVFSHGVASKAGYAATLRRPMTPSKRHT